MLEWWQVTILIIIAMTWFFAWTVHALEEYGVPGGFFMGPILAVAYPVMVLLGFLFFFAVGWALSGKRR